MIEAIRKFHEALEYISMVEELHKRGFFSAMEKEEKKKFGYEMAFKYFKEVEDATTKLNKESS